MDLNRVRSFCPVDGLEMLSYENPRRVMCPRTHTTAENLEWGTSPVRLTTAELREWFGALRVCDPVPLFRRLELGADLIVKDALASVRHVADA